MNRLIPLFVLASLASCASTTSFLVEVDGLAAPASATIQTYALDPVTPTDPLLWQELAGCIERTLQERGWRRVAEADAADCIVDVEFGISAPEEYEATYQDPVWGQTGETTSYVADNNPYTSYQATSTTTPVYGITHYETRAYTAVRYHRHLNLTAHSAHDEQLLWRTRVRSSGSSGDFRRVFPFLLAAAQPHFGRSTGKTVQVTLKENDDLAAEIAGR